MRDSPVVISLAPRVAEITRFDCDVSCAASFDFLGHRTSFPCKAKKWTGQRYECSLVSSLDVEQKNHFVELLLAELRSTFSARTRGVQSSETSAAD